MIGLLLFTLNDVRGLLMKKFLIRILSGFLVLTIIVVFGLVALSPQQTPAFLNEHGQPLANSIAEIRDIELNGSMQRVLIRGANRDNPILLHLHGGPGGPDQTLLQSTGATIEDMFTVVYWDQRGAGASYSSDHDIANLTLNQIVDDGILLSQILSKEFEQQKIFLQGHSWGTLVGIKMAAAEPKLFKAFISVGQLVHAVRAEILSFDYALAEAQKANDQKTIDALSLLGRPPYDSDQKWIDSVMVQRSLLMPYELPQKAPLFTMFETYQSFIMYPGYSIRDKLNSLRGFETSLPKLWMEVINTDLFSGINRLEVPVYFIQGNYDKHTVTSLVREYFEFIDAPQKHYIEFKKSAHWPHLREHQKYRETMQNIKLSFQGN